MTHTLRLNDGHEIPQVGFGTWQIPDADAAGLVAEALRVGYRHIDTAAVYGNEKGVGRGLASSGVPRDEVYVTTKLWNTDHAKPRKALKASLKRLGLDHVDLYLIHWPGHTGSYIDAWRELIALRDEGLTRSIGVSNFGTKHLDRVISASDVVPAVNQIEVHPTFTQVPLRATNRHFGIVTEAWSPLGQGYDLTNPTILEIAEAVGRTPAQVIVRWQVEQCNVVLPKSSTPQRIAENSDVYSFDLTDEQVAEISSLDRGHRIGPDPDHFG